MPQTFTTKEDLFAHARREILQNSCKDIVYEKVEADWAFYVLHTLDEDGEVEGKGARCVYPPSTM